MVARGAAEPSSGPRQRRKTLDEFDPDSDGEGFPPMQGLCNPRQRSILKGMSVVQGLLLIAFIREGLRRPKDEQIASVVKVLSEDSLPLHVAGHPDGTLINFYSAGCSHCEALAPELEAAAKELQKRNSFEVGVVNAAVAPAAFKRYSVSKLPTLMYFSKGRPVREVPPTKHTASRIVEFVEWAAQPSVIEFARADLDEAEPQIRAALKPGAPPVIICYAATASIRADFEMVGESFRGDTAFLITHEARAGDPLLKTLSLDNSTDKEYREDGNLEQIQAWVQEVLAKKPLTAAK